MKDDEVDQMLRQLPKTSDSTGEPLDDGLLLAWRAGTLPEATAREVERRLAADPEARALLAELSEELTPGEVDALVTRLTPPSNVIPLRRRRALVWGSVTAALAASVVVAMLPSREVLRYQLEIEGGDAPTRGSAQAERVVVSDGSRLTLRLRAERASDSPRVLGVFVEDGERRLSRVPAELTSSRGSFEVRLEGGAWAGGPGLHRLWLLLAADEQTLAAAEGQPQDARRDEGLGWWAVEVERRTE